jgi:hypothetical protein
VGPALIDPLTVARRTQSSLLRQRRLIGNVFWAATVAGEQFAVPRNVVVHRPLVTRQPISNPRTCFDVNSRQPELIGPWSLQVVPHPLAIGAKELVLGNVDGEQLHRTLAPAPKISVSPTFTIRSRRCELSHRSE